MRDGLITTIASDLNIGKGIGESDTDWRRRVLYSFIGLNMLTATYDYDDDMAIDKSSKGTVSMSHILNRANELADIFETEYDETCARAMRETYIGAGYMLHQASRLAYPLPTCSRVGEIFLSRGQLPWTVKYMSGLGTFTNSCDENSLVPWDEMFCVEKESIAHWFNQFEKKLNWRKMDQLPENVEYSNITETPFAGYWLNRPPLKGIAICRDKRDGDRQYNMVRIDTPYDMCPLPTWQAEHIGNQIRKPEYLRILLALRIQAGQVPTIKIQRNGSIAKISADFLLPPFEQNLYELYSWPDVSHPRWNRIVAIQMIPLIIGLFTRMGFIVNEEITSNGNSKNDSQ